MAKLTLDNPASGYASTATINANNDAIEAAIENTLSRDGTGPNHMTAALDMNGNMILNQGNPITVSGFNWEGPWVTATAYSVGDVVENSNSSYICIVAHTSGTFATDLAAVKWQVVASAASLPTQTGNSGKVLTTNGSNASWAAVNTLALPIGGGTLTGALNGTAATFSGALAAGATTFTGAMGVTGNVTVSGAQTVTSDLTVGDDLTVSGAIIPSADGITGTVAGGNAPAGAIGEYYASSVVLASAVSLSSATAKNVTSISLPAGDWDVEGTVLFTYGATTSITSLFGSISLTSNTTTGFAFSHRCAAFVPGTAPMGYVVPRLRVSISSPTTVYLIAVAGFTVSTCAAYGIIEARRVR